MADSEGSEYDRLFYPFLFAHGAPGGTTNAEEILAQVRHSTIEKCAEVVAIRRTTLTAYADTIVAAGIAMANAVAVGATVWAFGNGGSSTDAQDLAADLLHPPWPDCPPVPAVALTGDVAVITAVGNDVGFENVFARQVIAFGQPGDIAVGISTSGNSTNVLHALDQAKKQGLVTVGLAGYDGGKMARARAVDYCVVARSEHIPRVQEAQATAYHALLSVLYTVLRTAPANCHPAMKEPRR
jgi:D-sedoheptulose 7-phosphate isomerase